MAAQKDDTNERVRRLEDTCNQLTAYIGQMMMTAGNYETANSVMDRLESIFQPFATLAPPRQITPGEAATIEALRVSLLRPDYTDLEFRRSAAGRGRHCKQGDAS